jgi:DNA transformation protein
VDDTSVDDLLAALAPLGEMRARRMFGGVGLYCDDTFFGLVAEGTLYFKVDEHNADAYRSAGMEPFRPYPDRPAAGFGYYAVPLEVQERREHLVEWARLALAAARGRDASKRARKKARRPSRARAPKNPPVADLENIDRELASRLHEIGIDTAADLEGMGAVVAYHRLRKAGFEVTTKHLYALEGARLGMRSDRLSEAIKANLRARSSIGGKTKS